MSEEPNGGAVRITNREIYDAVEALKADVSELAHKFDTALRDLDELRDRTRSLELKFYGILAALVGSVVVILRLAGVSI